MIENDLRSKKDGLERKISELNGQIGKLIVGRNTYMFKCNNSVLVKSKSQKIQNSCQIDNKDLARELLGLRDATVYVRGEIDVPFFNPRSGYVTFGLDGEHSKQYKLVPEGDTLIEHKTSSGVTLFFSCRWNVNNIKFNDITLLNSSKFDSYNNKISQLKSEIETLKAKLDKLKKL